MTTTNKITSTETSDPKLKQSASAISIQSIVATASTCGHRTRHIIALQSAFIMASLMGNIVCFNAAVVKISELESSPFYDSFLNGSEVDWIDGSLETEDKRIDLSQVQISLIFGIPFAGALVAVVPITMLMNRYGSYTIMLINSIISCLGTALTPLVVILNFNLLLVFRFFIGAAQCQLYPVIGTIVKTWAPLHEKTVFVSILTGYSQISAIVTTFAASWLAKNCGWPSIFYAQAGFCGCCILFWILHFRNNPEKHPFVSEKEFGNISHGKHAASLQTPSASVPFYKLLLSPCVIAPCIAMTVYIMLIQFNVVFLVMYFVWVMKLDINVAGLMSTLPFVVQLVVQFTTGILSDRIKFISEALKIRIFNSLAFYCTGVGLIISTFFDTFEQSGLCIAIIIVSFCMLGFNSGGFPKSAVLISSQCPASVMACLQASMTIGLLINPFIVSSLTPNRLFEEYALLFRVYGGLLIGANTFFLIFAKSKTQHFVPSLVPTVNVTPAELNEQVETGANINRTAPKISFDLNNEDSDELR